MKTGVFFNSVLLCTTEKHRQFVCAPVICSLWLLQLSCIVDVRRYIVGRILYKQNKLYENNGWVLVGKS